MPSALEDLVANMTIGELAQRSGRSVDAIASWALSGKAARGARKDGTPSTGSDVNTRTEDGRKAFDEAVLEAVRNAGGESKAADLAEAVGGTALQRRTALARLVQRRKLRRSGQARSTTYALP